MIDQRTAPWAALLLRVTLGSLFIAHLYWKFAILPGGLNTWWSNFAVNKYPPITPWYCISAEIFGAVLLIPGIWTMGRTIRAAIDSRCGALLDHSQNHSQRLLLCWCRLRTAFRLVGHASGPSTVGGRAICPNAVVPR